MSKAIDIPETVILEMQRKVYEFKNEIKQREKALEEARKAYNNADSDRAYAVKQLRETLDFLQEHNSDAIDRSGSWYEELGFTREELLEMEKKTQVTVTS